MRSALAVGAVLLASISGSVADSNTAVTFTKFLPGSYQLATSIAPDGSCPKTTKPYSSSPIAPLDEELSVLFRGPGQLLQMAVYNLDTSATKRSAPVRRSHRQYHERNQELRARLEQDLEKRVCGATVSVPGMTPWINKVGCTEAELAALGSSPSPVAAAADAISDAVDSVASDVSSALEYVDAGLNNWGRVAYYDSCTGNSTGLTFLANNQWNTNNGIANFLGYTAADGVSPATEPTVLGNVTFLDEQTIIISSSEACNDTCGATTPGATAYTGFPGEEKMFLFEYTMPFSGNRSTPYADAPALWMLNTNIVNIQQFSECSGWATGAGELDLQEVINHGDDYGVSALHMGQNYAGTPDSHHPRPTTGSQKLAAIFTQGVVHVQILPDDTSFDEIVDAADVVSYLQNSAAMLFDALPMKK